MAKRKAGRGRGRGHIEVIPEHAAAYGVKIPKEQESADHYLSPNDIGRILNVTGEAVKQWIYHRRLPAVKLVNGYWKVKVADLESFLKARHEIGKRKVLVTDTRDGEMKEVVDILQELGHDPVVTYGFADALLKAVNFHPALYLINVSVKETAPWKLVEKIRATKALKKTPVLLLANEELNDPDSDLAMKLGVQGFIKRPFDKATLSDAINLAMNLAMA
jgi:CheY-like chemotaxis protein